MSRVTGVMLICEVSGNEERPDEQMAEILAWLAERETESGKWALTEISDHAGGWKHPQFDAWSGGFNWFGGLEDEFAAFVMSREWGAPENLVLIMQPEEGETRVFRPERNAVISVANAPNAEPMKAVGPPPAFPKSWAQRRR